MNGYLRPYAPDATHRRVLMSYQCGLCHHIGETYGFPYRILAGPDLVFYNLFLDTVGGALASEGKRPCVLTPGVMPRACRDVSANTRIAAAFGVWMAVEKLRDDAADDGGLLKWLAARAFAPGAARARDTLRAEGFPVDAVTTWMAEQARVERDQRDQGDRPADAAADRAADLEAAIAPTAAIAALTFGFAARHATPDATPDVARDTALPDAATSAPAATIGAALGRYLFWMDNLLDYGRDVASGGYNALARAHGAHPMLPNVARTTAVAGARAAIADLDATLPALPVAGDRRWLSKVLVDGLTDKLRRWQALPLAARATADLPEISPPSRLRLRARRLFARFDARARAALALAALWLFPRLARAQDTADWWPTDAGDLGLDTGDTGGAEVLADPAFSHQPFDIVCGNAGSCDAEGCGDACGDSCDVACDDACSGIDCCG